MAECCASIVPTQFSFSPRFDAELPAVPAPQREMLHPHQLHISTSRVRELLAYPWWPCVSATAGKNPRVAARSHMIRADSPHCACASAPPCACTCGQALESISASDAASQAPGLTCTAHVPSAVMRRPLVDSVSVGSSDSEWLPRTGRVMVGDPFHIGSVLHMYMIFSSSYMSVAPTHVVYHTTHR